MSIEVYRRKKSNMKILFAILFAAMPGGLISMLLFVVAKKVKEKTKRNFKNKPLLLDYLKEVNASRQKPRTLKSWAFQT